MSNFDAYNLDEQAAITHLKEQGYVVIENLLDTNEIGALSKAVDRIFKQERENPFNPSDINDDEDDQSLREYLINSYKISENESERLMNRIKHTRKLNHDTPWPLPPDKMNKSFLHVPTLFDYDKSQRIWNLPAKLQQSEKLIEHPILLSLVRAMLEEDCVLSDISATSIGPNSVNIFKYDFILFFNFHLFLILTWLWHTVLLQKYSGLPSFPQFLLHELVICGFYL